MSVFKSKQIGDVIQFIGSGDIAVIITENSVLYLCGEYTPQLTRTTSEFSAPSDYNTLFSLTELVKDAATSDE